MRKGKLGERKREREGRRENREREGGKEKEREGGKERERERGKESEKGRGREGEGKGEREGSYINSLGPKFSSQGHFHSLQLLNIPQFLFCRLVRLKTAPRGNFSHA